MPNLNPLRFCYHGQHVRPRSMFRALPGGDRKREVCAECYEKIMSERKAKARMRNGVTIKPKATLRGKASKASGTNTMASIAPSKSARAAKAAKPKAAKAAKKPVRAKAPKSPKAAPRARAR